MPTIPEFYSFQSEFSSKVMNINIKYGLDKVKRYYLFNMADTFNTNDIPKVQSFKMKKNEGYFKTSILKDERLSKLFNKNKDVFESNIDDYICAYTNLAEEIKSISGDMVIMD